MPRQLAMLSAREARDGPAGAGERMFMRCRRPVELALTSALRRLARRRPDVFERLGPFREALFVVAPREIPVAFRLEPRGAAGTVTVVTRAQAALFDVRISGALPTLLRLFDGTGDADSAFFSRAVKVEGAVEAVVALHNALEAADLDLADLAGPVAPGLRRLLRFSTAWRSGPGGPLARG